jgi:hypothetical protein
MGAAYFPTSRQRGQRPDASCRSFTRGTEAQVRASSAPQRVVSGSEQGEADHLLRGKKRYSLKPPLRGTCGVGNLHSEAGNTCSQPSTVSYRPVSTHLGPKPAGSITIFRFRLGDLSLIYHLASTFPNFYRALFPPPALAYAHHAPRVPIRNDEFIGNHAFACRATIFVRSLT